MVHIAIVYVINRKTEFSSEIKKNLTFDLGDLYFKVDNYTNLKDAKIKEELLTINNIRDPNNKGKRKVHKKTRWKKQLNGAQNNLLYTEIMKTLYNIYLLVSGSIHNNEPQPR